MELDLLNEKILSAKIPNYEKIENNFIDEEFIELKELDRLKIDLQYPKLGFENVVNKAYIRKTAYEMLLKALQILPKEYGFKVLDVWRPFALQKELFVKYSEKIIKDFKLENLSEKDRVKFISQFVANPIEDRNYPPMHTSGGAIDLILIDSNGEELDLGVGFDEFTEKTNTDYYEINDENEKVKLNRRLLYNCMTQSGFTNLASEIWHYDYGDKNWAFYTNNKSLYKGVFTKEEIEKNER